MAALDPVDQTRIDNLIIAHDAAKAAMLTIIADSGAGIGHYPDGLAGVIWVL